MRAQNASRYEAPVPIRTSVCQSQSTESPSLQRHLSIRATAHADVLIPSCRLEAWRTPEVPDSLPKVQCRSRGELHRAHVPLPMWVSFNVLNPDKLTMKSTARVDKTRQISNFRCANKTKQTWESKKASSQQRAAGDSSFALVFPSAMPSPFRHYPSIHTKAASSTHFASPQVGCQIRAERASSCPMAKSKPATLPRPADGQTDHSNKAQQLHSGQQLVAKALLRRPLPSSHLVIPTPSLLFR